MISAITPFNHPMNQVAHKVVPAIATNNRMVLKPSEKVPLSAIVLADILYEAGLPPEMLQVVTGDPREIADELITNGMSTWSPSPVAWRSASTSPPRPATGAMVLELGGNDPIIVMEDADLEEAATLAVQARTRTRASAAPRSSACWCSATVADRFVELLVAKTKAWTYGDPMDAKLDMGTVIDETAARCCEAGERGGGAAARGCWSATSATARSIRRRWSTTCART